MYKNDVAALYIRVSTQYQVRKGESLEVQKNRLIEWCNFNGITQYEIFEDAGVSSKDESIVSRPAYNRMLNKIKQKKFTILVVTKLDRINRNVVDFNNMYNILKKNNVKFVSIDNGFDTSTPIGKAMVQICLVFGQMEIEQLSERVLETHLNVVSTSGKLQGRPPFGYVRGKNGTPEAGKAIVVKEEAEIVKKIYKMYLSGKSSGQIATYLNQNKIFGRKGGMWITKGITDILHNEFYIGTYIYNRCTSGTRKPKPKEEWIILKDHHTAIISKEDFDLVQKKISENTKSHNTSRSANIHLFKNIIVCGKCGKNYVSAIEKNPYRKFPPSTYSCSRKYRKDKGCQNDNVSDTGLVPFIFRLMRNLIQLSDKSIKNIRSKDELEKFVLRGNELSKVMGLDEDSLLCLWRLYCTKNLVPYFSTDEDDGLLDDRSLKTNALLTQREKLIKSMDRLKTLFSMGDDSYSAEEYLKDRHEIESKVMEIDNELTELSGEEHQSLFFDTEVNDTFFYEKLLYYRGEIDYGIMDEIGNKNMIRKIISALIKTIIVTNGQVDSIEFTNGLKLGFNYKNIFGTICPACGKAIGKTNCKKRTLMDTEDNWYQRIRIGDPKDIYTKYTKDKRCAGCYSKKGMPHHFGCQYETCPVCGSRVTDCGHLSTEDPSVNRRRKHQKMFYNADYCILCKRRMPSTRCERLQFIMADGKTKYSRVGITPENTPLINNACPGCGVKYNPETNRKYTHHFGCKYELCPICFKPISECKHFTPENLKL